MDCLSYPPSISDNSPQLHLDGVIALGSWQNLSATRKRTVGSDGEHNRRAGVQVSGSAQRRDMQKTETKQNRGESPRGQGRGCKAYLDVRICCTCWGVSAKVKCASSNLWLDVDARTQRYSYSRAHAAGGPRSCLIPSHIADPQRLNLKGKIPA